jgi:hypothetical protein
MMLVQAHNKMASLESMVEISNSSTWLLHNNCAESLTVNTCTEETLYLPKSSHIIFAGRAQPHVPI